MMKKIAIVTVLVVLGMKIFAFEYLGKDKVEVTPKYFLAYDFFSVNLNSPVDILSLGLFIPSGYTFDSTDPEEIFENNTGLSPAVKHSMNRKKANLCMTMDENGYIYINILLPNGRYTTVVYH
jgi:hypothetical protein